MTLTQVVAWATSAYGLSWGLFLGALVVIGYLGLKWLPRDVYEHERKENGATLDCLSATTAETVNAVQSNHEALGRIEGKVDALLGRQR